MRLILLLLISFLSTLGMGQDRVAINSLLNELAVTKDTARAYVLYKLYSEYAVNDKDSASLYIEDALKQSLSTGDSLAITKSYYGRAWLARYNEDYKSALPGYEMALGIAHRNGFEKWEMYILNDLSLLHSSIANYDKALAYNFQSLEMREKEGDLSKISIALNNIGFVYLSLGDYENGISYFLQAYQKKIESNDSYDKDLCLINIAVCYNGLHQYQKAIESLAEAKAMCGKECPDNRLMILYNALGDAQLGVGRLKESEKNFLLSFKCAERANSTRFKSASLNSLAKIKMQNNDLDSALGLIDSAYNLVRATELKGQLLECYELYANIYRRKFDFQRASEFQQKYAELKENIINMDIIKNISRIQSDYQERENIKLIDAKNELLMLKETQVNQNKIIALISISMGVILFVLSIILWKGITNKKKMNSILDEKIRERTLALEKSYSKIQRISFQQQQSIERLTQKVHSRVATLRGITEVAKLDVEDAKGLSYISKIEDEANKFNIVTEEKLEVRSPNSEDGE